MARVVIPGFRKIETSGGGEGGTTNYNDLTNKPFINNVPLVGNLNTVDLKLTDKTLTEEGVPAEAKTVGQKLEEQSTSLTAVKEELTKKANISDIPTKVSELQNEVTIRLIQMLLLLLQLMRQKHMSENRLVVPTI